MPGGALCAECWGKATPRERAPFILAMRQDPAAHRDLAHRDPVRNADGNLAAYIDLLERRLGMPGRWS
jgi:hypothetical protein